jgi:hypothetical protein
VSAEGAQRQPIGGTWIGLSALCVLGGGFGLASAAMVLFRDRCEPVLRLVLPLVATLLLRGGHPFHYDPDNYYFWAGAVGLMALLWVALIIRAMMLKPGQDRRLEAHLRAQLGQSARGAPLNPN